MRVTFSFLAIPLGLVVGVTLGTLGGGGSILTVPALVYLIGENPQHATTASLVIVGVTAITGTAGHARAGRVRWGAGLVFGIVGAAGSLLGSVLNRLVDPDVLLLGFAGLMALTAAAMLQRSWRHGPAKSHPFRGSEGSLTTRRVLEVVSAGTVVGFMTGFFGVGGGFVVVPAMVLALDFAMPEAVGTGLLVIALNSVTALAARGGIVAVDWGVVAPFAVSAMVGSLLGYRVAARIPAKQLARIFAVLLVLLAIYVASRSVVGLA